MEAKPQDDQVDDATDAKIRWMLSLTVGERLAWLQGFIDGLASVGAIPESIDSTENPQSAPRS